MNILSSSYEELYGTFFIIYKGTAPKNRFLYSYAKVLIINQYLSIL